MSIARLEAIAAIGLAVFRVAWLIAREDGPFGLAAWLRGKIDPNQRTWLGRGINCPSCLGFWLALAAALLLGGTWLDGLAIAGVATVLYRLQ